jgi:hypothetical protein
MLKSIINFFLFIEVIYSSTVELALKKCEDSTVMAIQQIKKQNAEIQALTEVINKQNKAGAWLVKGPDASYRGSDKEKIKLSHKLEYVDGLYYIRISGKLKRYDIEFNSNTGKYDVVDAPDYDIILDIKGIHDFKPSNTKPRPYDYFPNFFKLGGVILPQFESKTVRGDIALMYEFFSFDKAFNFYGWSLNASVGVRHAGVLFGYQFLESTYFRNTNFVVGYAYDFLSGTNNLAIGISLNF